MDELSRLNTMCGQNFCEMLTDSFPSEQINLVCRDLSAAMVGIVDQTFSSPTIEKFLKSTFPKLIELLFRRHSARRDEQILLNTFKDVISFLAQTSSLYILELCELRNLLLIGGNQYGFLFIDSKQIMDQTKSSSSFTSGHSFYSDFGRPVHALIEGRSVCFWPDDWKFHLHGNKAIGSRLQYLSSSDVLIDGTITAYNPLLDVYEIESWNDNIQKLESVDLSATSHWWIDAAPTNSNGNTSRTERLLFSNQDIGKFVRIWWSRYNRFYYGRVVAFDSSKLTHTVTYEDKDSRVYDMRAKDYEIVNIPPEFRKQTVGLPDAAAAQIAAEWHRTKGALVNVSSKDPASLSSENLQRTQSSVSSSDAISRPSPTIAFNLSIHQIQLINRYFADGGVDKLLSTMTDTDQSPPGLSIILTHLQLLYQLKPFLGPKKFRSMTWEMKEAVAFAISRFDETELKDFNFREYYDVHNLLKDIITIASNESNESTGVDFLESLDYLHLTISIKLFSTLKVQKRSIGLSMLKDYVEILHPKISQFLSNRYSALRNRRTSATLRSQPQNKSLGRAFISTQNFDKWFLGSSFLDILLGDSFHQDLVSKADTIFVYMAHRRLLTEYHLNLLWQCTKGAHEAVTRVIYTLVLAIIPALDIVLRNYLFSLISSANRRDYSVQFVQFIASFTIQAVRTSKEDDTKGSSSESFTADDGSRKDDKSQTGKSSLRSKAQIINAPQRQYFGFSLLWQYVLNRTGDSESVSHNDDVIEAAISAIVELLREEFTEDREAAMQTCIENVELGTSVATSLSLLRRVLLLYPSPAKTWFVLSRQPASKAITITHQVDKLIKQSRLLEIIFAELDHYHKKVLVKEQKASEESQVVGRVTRVAVNDKSKGKDVMERLEFLQFVLSKASVKLSDQQLSILWRVFGESASNGDTIDSLCTWLDALVSEGNKKVGCIIKLIVHEIDHISGSISDDTFKFVDQNSVAADEHSMNAERVSIVDEAILTAFFENNLLPWAFSDDKVSILSRPSVASLFIKLFIFANLSKKTIKVDSDTNWSRTGQIIGSAVLWRIAMDSSHFGSSHLCSKLLVELQQRNTAKVKSPDGIRGNFLQLCFKQIYFNIHNLQSQEEDDALVTTGRVDSKQDHHMGQMPSEWFESNFKAIAKDVALRRVARLVVVLRLFMCRFIYNPAYFVKVKVYGKNDDLPVCTFRCPSYETLGAIRTRISQFFKESPDMMLLYMKDGGERLDKDTVMLSSIRASLEVSLVARKVEGGGTVNVTTSTQRTQTNHVADVPDVITADQMRKISNCQFDPVLWLKPSTDLHTYKSLHGMKSDHDSYIYPMRSAHERIFQESGKVPQIRQDMCEGLESVMEYLSIVIRANEKYIFQLLGMLDGFLAAESTTGMKTMSFVWDIIQLLPFQPSLVNQITQLSKASDPTILKHLLDIHNPNRLLYSLQIIDSLFEPAQSRNLRSPQLVDFKLIEWSHNFFELGGLEQLLVLLKDVLKLAISTEQTMTAEDGTSGASHFYMIGAFILRLIHRILLVDPMYRLWQPPKSVTLYESEASKSSTTVPGLFLSLVEIDKLLKDITLLTTTAFQKFYLGELSHMILWTVAENAALLGLGVAAAHEEGSMALKDSGLLSVLLYKCCMSLDNADVRYSVAACLFDEAVGIYSRCVDPVTQQDKKRSRISLLDFVHKSIIDCVVGGRAPSGGLITSNQRKDTVYNLLCAIECLRVNPATILKEVNVPIGNNNSPTTIAKDSVQGSSFELVSGMNGPDPSSYFPIIMQQLANYQSAESFHSIESDGTLLGFLRLISVFAAGSDAYRSLLKQTFDIGDNGPVNIATLLYSRCLFPSLGSVNGSTFTILCQTDYSRKLALSILNTLCDEDTVHFRNLVNVMYRPQWQESSSLATRKRVYWDYDPSALLKKKDEYLGLKNQGGTCYMNSFLQQLYHIKAFRDGLLQVSSYSTEAEYENVLFQLQVMFGYLKLSQKKYYDTLPFCQAIIDYDGQPISLSEQKDINEFAGMLFDKLEKTTDCNEILKNTIRGTLVWKTKSLETPYRSEREECFYMITLEVKDKKCIEDSLELSIAEELFSGENKIEDSVAKVKVDATRRAAIRHLPPTLIIQLKRFEFDLETMNRKKLNDYMAFPTELDMFPYTEEGVFDSETEDSEVNMDEQLPEMDDEGTQEKQEKYTAFTRPIKKADSHYQYVLTGVVAHVGAIDRGHYYSFVKERESDNWYEFNDRMVLPFSPELIPKECFGGSDESFNNNGTQKIRENNAYLLVYERKEALKPVSMVLSPALSLTELDKEGDGESSPTTELSLKSPLGGSNFKANNISDRVLRFILSENADFQMDRFRFDAELFSFIWSLVNSPTLTTLMSIEANDDVESNEVEQRLVSSKECIQGWASAVLQFIFEVAIRARAKGCTMLLITKLEESIVKDKSKQTATAILEQLSSVPPLKATSSEPESIDGNQSDKQRSGFIWNFNPWLETLMFECPHGGFVFALAKVVKVTINSLTSKLEKEGAVHLQSILMESDLTEFTTSEDDAGSNTSTNKIVAQISPQDTAKRFIQRISQSLLVYRLANLCDQLLNILEHLSIDDIYYKDGFTAVCDILNTVALSGSTGLCLLLRLRSLERTVLVLLSLNSSRHQIPAAKFSKCFEFAANIVKGCFLSLNLKHTELTHSVLPNPELSDMDKQAFLNKIFLSDAISIATQDTSSALQMLCKGLQVKDVSRLLDFIAEKIVECTSTNNGTSLVYRQFFKVLSDLLLGPLLLDLDDYSSTLRKLVSSAYALSSRQQLSDAEFVYAVCKLLHRLGTTGPAAYAVVMQLYDYWRDISVRFAHSAPKKQSLSVFSLPQGNTHIPQGKF